jgi:urea transporter
MKVIDFLKIISRGISQVMLQNNIITGLLFLIGIFYNSWLMGIGALIGVLISTLTAFILECLLHG